MLGEGGPPGPASVCSRRDPAAELPQAFREPVSLRDAVKDGQSLRYRSPRSTEVTLKEARASAAPPGEGQVGPESVPGGVCAGRCCCPRGRALPLRGQRTGCLSQVRGRGDSLLGPERPLPSGTLSPGHGFGPRTAQASAFSGEALLVPVSDPRGGPVASAPSTSSRCPLPASLLRTFVVWVRLFADNLTETPFSFPEGKGACLTRFPHTSQVLQASWRCHLAPPR